ncbi:MAG: hypothetical protein ACFBSD_10245, partial [Paracoccaceae bacterium]
MSALVRRLALLAVVLALAACAGDTPPPPPPALAAADAVCARAGDPDDDDTDGGFGGTGILGRVSDGPRLQVNGLDLRHAPDLTVAGVEGPAPVAALRPGETILAEAVEEGSALCAVRIARYRPLVGQVTMIDLATGRLRVLGVPVSVDADAPVRDAAGREIGLGALPLGARVSVSGIWNGETVAASAIDMAAPSGPSALTGSVDPEGRRLGGQRLDPAPGILLPPGEALTLIGRETGGSFRVETVRRDLATPLAPGIGRLSVEGFAEAGPRRTVVSGLPGLAVEGARPGERAVFGGPVGAVGPGGLGRRSGLGLGTAPVASLAPVEALRRAVATRTAAVAAREARAKALAEAVQGVLDRAPPGTPAGALAAALAEAAPSGTTARDLAEAAPGISVGDIAAAVAAKASEADRTAVSEAVSERAAGIAAAVADRAEASESGAGPLGGRAGPGAGPVGGRGGPGAGPVGGRG